MAAGRTPRTTTVSVQGWKAGWLGPSPGGKGLQADRSLPTSLCCEHGIRAPYSPGTLWGWVAEDQ